MLNLPVHSCRLRSIGEIAKVFEISQNHLMIGVSDLASANFVRPFEGAAADFVWSVLWKKSI